MSAEVVMDDNYGMIQVVVPPAVQAALREWLASKGPILFRIPAEAKGDDLPTYGVAVEQLSAADAMTAAQYEDWSADPEEG